MLASRGMSIVRALIAALLLAAAPGALAEVKVSIDYGFGGLYRSGRWTPVYITVSDPSSTVTRNVRATLHGPHDQSHAIGISTRFAIRPEPSTAVIYAPIMAQLDETVLYIRELGSNTLLAKKAFAEPITGSGRVNPNMSHGDILIGLSGRGRAMEELNGQFTWDTNVTQSVTPLPNADEVLEEHSTIEPQGQHVNWPRMRIGRVETLRLPDVVVGYDSLDALVLNAPDLVRLSPQKQKAIADWVRGGGRLMLWPGDHILPDSSPLIDILPCTIGELHEIHLSVEETKRHNLQPSLERLPAKQLAARPGGRMYSVLGGKGQVCIGRVGLGNVAVLSFEADRLRFLSENKPGLDLSQNARRFWRPILRKLLEPDIKNANNNDHYWYGTAEDMRHDRALLRVVDQLGNVPGVGAFDISYILMVLLAMMFIVGPIDWWVLRKLNRQPWTWVTITGWIVLITTGAIFIGTLFKSGDLHYRTVRLIDQAEGQVVGVHDVIGIYSPRTQEYGLQGPGDMWWRPAPLNPLRSYQRRRATGGRIEFDQGRNGQLLRGSDPSGKSMATMTVNVWNLRFLESAFADTSAVKPVIAAELRRVGEAFPGTSLATIAGTITNLGDKPLRNVRILVGDATVIPTITAIEPGKTVEFSTQAQPPVVKPKNENQRYYPRYESRAYDEQDAGSAFARATSDLASDRSDRIKTLLETRKDVAVIIADSEDVAATIGLVHENDEPPLEKHWRVVRAVVPLKGM